MQLIMWWFIGYVLSFAILLLACLVADGKITKSTILHALGFSFFSWMMVVIGLLVLIVSLISYKNK